MPRKIASTKNDSPSKANGSPSTSPNRPISPGHSRPISKLSTVPETAPIANSTAETFAHRCARPSATGSSRTIPRRCTTKIIVGNATPKQARMMCHPRLTAICSRAGMSPGGAAVSGWRALRAWVARGSTRSTVPTPQCRTRSVPSRPGDFVNAITRAPCGSWGPASAASAADEPAGQQRAVLLGQRVQLQRYVDRRTVGDPGVLAGDQGRHGGAAQLVGDPLGEQVAQQVRPALGQDAGPAARHEGGAQRGQVDPVATEDQHVLVPEQRARLVAVLGVLAGRH